MTEHKSNSFFLGIFGVIIYCRVLYTVGLVWKDAPDEVVNVQQGSNITMKWHYEMEENETFLYSDLVSNDRKSKVYYLLASRYKGQSRYYYLSDKKQTKLENSGKNNVILTLFSVELESSNSVYCCIVIWDYNKRTKREERCTTIHIYDPPRITSPTPQLYCKQGDQVKLQCNATGYPEPRVRWIHRDTKQIIGNSSVTSLNITGKRSEGSYCCEVKNRFGRETACTIVKVTDQPKFTSKMSTRYTMTTKTIRITCSATGTPKPNITWTKENTEDVVSTEEHYEVPYVKCANKTLTFYCHASNVMGSIRSKEIQVQVMTQRSCTSDSNKDIITKEKKLLLIVGISCGTVLITICCLTVVVFIFLKKRKGHTSLEQPSVIPELVLADTLVCSSSRFLDENPSDEDVYPESVDTLYRLQRCYLLPNSPAAALKGKVGI